MICKGCDYDNQMREHEEGLEHRCAFCREPLAVNKLEEVFYEESQEIQ